MPVSRRRQREVIFNQKLGEIGLYEFLAEHQFKIKNFPFTFPFVTAPSREDRLQVDHEGVTYFFDCYTNRRIPSKPEHRPWFLRPGAEIPTEYVALCEVRHERLGYYVDIYAVMPRQENTVIGAMGLVKFASLQKLGAAELFPILGLLKSEN
jgi:hypothetical protein